MNKIVQAARNIGVCERWTRKLTGEETDEQLFDLYRKEGQFQEFCDKHRFPPVELLRASRETAERYGILVDKTGEIKDPDFLALYGDCCLTVVSTVYTRLIVNGNSRVRIRAEGMARVDVDLYDRARIIGREGTGKIVVCDHVK